MTQNALLRMDDNGGRDPSSHSPDELKERLREQFGESTDPLVNKETGEPVPEGYMCERKRILWVPEGVDNAHGITLSTFVDAEDWEQGKGYYRDPSQNLQSALSPERTPTIGDGKHFESMYAVSRGETSHVLQADIVDTIATELGITHEQLLDAAMIRPAESTFPVRFDLDDLDGSILVTPIVDRETGDSPYDSMSFRSN